MQTHADPLDDHHSAIVSFLMVAAAVPDDRWTVPRAEGKWTPAEELEHIALSYEAFARDLRGGEPMRLIGKRWQRFIWRAVAMRRIIKSGRMPRAVSAPREVRPTGAPVSREAAMARVERASSDFERVFEAVWRDSPQRKVTHPYFGWMSLGDAARLVSVHTAHHTRFLSDYTG